MAKEKTIQMFKKRHPYLAFFQEQSWFDTLGALPDELIETVAGYNDSAHARRTLNRALERKSQVLASFPELATKPGELAVALENPDTYMKDKSGARADAKKYLSNKAVR